jgi:hypothetical protein
LGAFRPSAASTNDTKRLTSFLDEAQSRLSLRFWWWRWEVVNTGFDQKLPHNLPYDILNLGGVDIPRE